MLFSRTGKQVSVVFLSFGNIESSGFQLNPFSANISSHFYIITCLQELVHFHDVYFSRSQ